MKHQALRTSIDVARARVEDLQAEMEAAARCVNRIHSHATSQVDHRVKTFLIQAARVGELVRNAQQLRESIAQQRSLLRDLRASLNEVRAFLRTGPDR
jgi:hypothetical protein